VHRLSIVLALALAAPQAFAVPVTYRFTTGTTPFTAAPPGASLGIAEALSGFSVSGTFVYDADAPTTGTIPVPPLVGADIHTGAITALSGTVAGLGFSDVIGAATIGDEGYQPVFPPGVPIPPPPPADFLQLAAFAPGEPDDLAGFTFNGFDLLNVRLFWIEDVPMPDPVPDFLTGNDLPTLLPTFNGRLALDFGNNGTLNPWGVIFFDGLHVDPVSVPEPPTLLLLAAGLLGLAPRLRRARASRT
jgi:PEP-CTERM motif